MIVCWNSSTPSPRLYALVRTYVYSGVCIVIITDEGNVLAFPLMKVAMQLVTETSELL